MQLQKPEIPVVMLAFTVQQFCASHGLSRGQYYNLKKQGRGPREMKVDSRPRISAEAAAEWRRRMEAEAEVSVAA